MICDDHFGDLRPIIAGDLAAFVPAGDRHRSLTVVREVGDRDVAAEVRRWWETIRCAVADVEACAAIRGAVERWADGSRDGQLRGVLAVVRLDERGHRGLASGIDELWQVRARDPRDFRRLVEFARAAVVTNPSPSGIGCRCDLPAATPPSRAQLIGIVRVVLDASRDDRPRLLAWAERRLRAYAMAGVLDPTYVENVRGRLRAMCGGRCAR